MRRRDDLRPYERALGQRRRDFPSKERDGVVCKERDEGELIVGEEKSGEVCACGAFLRRFWKGKVVSNGRVQAEGEREQTYQEKRIGWVSD